MSGTHSIISNKISMLFGSEISLKDFSFSQLIVAVKNLFDTEGIPGFVKALVILVESLLIKLDKYSRKSRELEKLSLETVTNQSFRRSAKNLNDTMGFSTAHSTLHRC